VVPPVGLPDADRPPVVAEVRAAEVSDPVVGRAGHALTMPRPARLAKAPHLAASGNIQFLVVHTEDNIYQMARSP
jgi:hypothetical protein